MTVLITAEEARKLVVELRTSDALEDGGFDACELGNKAADMIEALHQQLADAEAAVALVVERACMAVSEQSDWSEDEHGRTEQPVLFARVINALRALAPDAGVKALAELRARERESAMQALASMGQAQEAYEAQLRAEAERDALAAKLAAAEARVGARVNPLVFSDFRDGGCVGRPHSFQYFITQDHSGQFWCHHDSSKHDSLAKAQEHAQAHYQTAALTTPAEETKG